MEEKENAEALVQEILAMARRDSAGIVAKAEAEAGGRLAAAAAEAEREGRAGLEAARAAAERRGQMLLAAVPLEAARLRAARLEALLSAVKGAALDKLAREPRGGAAALAAEALKGMEGDSFELTLPSGGGAGEALTAEIERLSGRKGLALKFLEDPALGGGVLARGAAGRQYWDNSFKARLERFWPELRSLLGAELPAEKNNERS